MGLDAYVRCNCYEEGRTSEPPVPRDQIEVDPEHGPALRSDREWTREQEYEFDAWHVDACEHHEMELCEERIGNWSGVGWLRWCLNAADPEGTGELPGLLPTANGGVVEPAAAVRVAAAIRELRDREAPIGRTRIILDSRGTMIEDEIDVWGSHTETGARILTPGWGYVSPVPDMPEIVIDGSVFVIRTRDDAHRELFRARYLGQRRLGAEGDAPADVSSKPGPHRFEYTDLEGDSTVTVWTHGVRTRVLWPTGSWYSRDHADRAGDQDAGYLNYYPRAVFVSERTIMYPEIHYQIRCLENLCSASVATGNPIVWC